MKRVVVVDHDDRARQQTTRALLEHGYLTHPAATPAEAEQIATQHPPDVVVVHLPRDDGGDCLQTVQRLRRTNRASVLAITDPESVAERVAAVEAELDGDMVAPVTSHELVARIDRLLRARGDGNRWSRQLGDLHIDESGRQVMRAGTDIELTRTEFDLLVAFARRPNTVLTKQALLDGVLGSAILSENALEAHISRLRRKLEEVGPRILHTARGVGYVLRPVTASPVPDAEHEVARQREQSRRRRQALARRHQLTRQATDEPVSGDMGGAAG